MSSAHEGSMLSGPAKMPRSLPAKEEGEGEEEWLGSWRRPVSPAQSGPNWRLAWTATWPAGRVRKIMWPAESGPNFDLARSR